MFITYNVACTVELYNAKCTFHHIHRDWLMRVRAIQNPRLNSRLMINGIHPVYYTALHTYQYEKNYSNRVKISAFIVHFILLLPFSFWWVLSSLLSTSFSRFLLCLFSVFWYTFWHFSYKFCSLFCFIYCKIASKRLRANSKYISTYWI